MDRSKVFYLVIVVILAATMLITACNEEEAIKWNDGEYIAKGQGHVGEIEVKVVIDSNKITKVEILEHNETPNIAALAFDNVPEEIIENQSWEVDTVSGATNTYEGIIEAVKTALEEAAVE
ncbi:FMN-binding protein [Fuchsiella alkaliacetigena]|uniref:FMN-binding protein n=1 Tax=Fuchsiella alkaliacetigena TaxID=957042 RepID=UPI00200A203F|nr:FMN-binding protein [Fuchsiella alkaliacetigena]MCK8826091.1 FMN-binding protein [Fuchsiella alkaliacetigena]